MSCDNRVYIVFGYDDYYPGGGMSDARALAGTLAEAKQKADAYYADSSWGNDNIAIVEIAGDTWREVAYQTTVRTEPDGRLAFVWSDEAEAARNATS